MTRRYAVSQRVNLSHKISVCGVKSIMKKVEVEYGKLVLRFHANYKPTTCDVPGKVIKIDFVHFHNSVWRR